MYYDYWIKMPETPAFAENLQLMKDKVKGNNGTAPSGISIGTKPSTGNVLWHFRLPLRMIEADIIIWLEEPMTSPIPPMAILSIRSSEKIIPIVIGIDPETGLNIIEMYYETLVIANKALFLPFMNDVIGSYDEDGFPIFRAPNLSDTLHISGYYGSEPIELE